LKKRFINTDKWIIPLATAVLLIIVWESAVRIFNVYEYILPAPSVIIKTLIKNIPVMWKHVLSTFLVAVLGFIISVVSAVIVSFAMESFKNLKKAVYPFIILSQTVPIIFIYPLLVIWFDFGLVPKLLVIVLVCFFPVTVNLSDGLSRTDPELIALFRSMKAGRFQILTMVQFPGALPDFFSGCKIAATYSIIGAVIAEWLGSDTGLGYYMILAYKSFSTASVFAAIIVVILLSLFIFGIILLLERIIISWKFIRSDL
jgi:putative hydroxymethylpyrimidine transport system permease protein